MITPHNLCLLCYFCSSCGRFLVFYLRTRLESCVCTLARRCFGWFSSKRLYGSRVVGVVAKWELGFFLHFTDVCPQTAESPNAARRRDRCSNRLFRCEDAVQNWDKRCKDVETEIKMHGTKFKCECFINMREFWHACRAFEYLHEYLRGNAGKPDCKIFSWIFVASDAFASQLGWLGPL